MTDLSSLMKTTTDEAPPRGQNLTQRLTPWFEKAIEAHAQEEVVWDLVIMPTPNGPLLTLTIAIKAMVLGAYATIAAQVEPLSLTEEGVDRVVFEALDLARQERTKQASTISS